MKVQHKETQEIIEVPDAHGVMLVDRGFYLPVKEKSPLAGPGRPRKKKAATKKAD